MQADQEELLIQHLKSLNELASEIAASIQLLTELEQDRNVLMAQQLELWRSIIKTYGDGDNTIKMKIN